MPSAVKARLLLAVPVLLSLICALLICLYPPPAAFGSIVRADNPSVRDALWWRTACNGVQCTLCPFRCFLPEGARGRCKVRVNSGGRLKTMVYGRAISAHIDPIEKKPVFHMLPGSSVYSVATAGCNLACKACQNWEISQIYPESAARECVYPSNIRVERGSDGRLYGAAVLSQAEFLPPEAIVSSALATRSASIAYTYSEPVVFFEYMLDTARLAKSRGLKNVMVTGGYINRGALRQLLPYMDVVKVDLKGFNDKFYRKYVGGELKYVQRALVEIKKSSAQLEVVNLVIPGLNDSPEEIKSLSLWVRDNLGKDTPLFFSRFSPAYRLTNLPQTPEASLTAARDIALAAGLQYVYVGNAPGHPGENTYCPVCKRPLIARYGYYVVKDLVSQNGGRCPYDGAKIPGVWR